MAHFSSCMLVAAVMLLSCVSHVSMSRILVMPYSLGDLDVDIWSMVQIAGYLQQDGHAVTLLIADEVKQNYDDPHLGVSEVITYKHTPASKGIGTFRNTHPITDHSSLWDVSSYISGLSDAHVSVCESLLSERRDKLRESIRSGGEYDLLIYDIHEHCGVIVQEMLNIPRTLMWSTAGAGFYTDVFFPELPSYICSSDSLMCSSDHLSFRERFYNFIYFTWIRYRLIPGWVRSFDAIKDRHVPASQTSMLTAHQRSLTLALLDPSLEFPRPLMPHVIAIPYMFHDSDKSPNVQLADKDIIYVCLSNEVSDNVYSMLYNSLNKMTAAYQTIWCASPSVQKLKNVMTVPKQGQSYMLSHNSTKLFITSADAISAMQATYYGIPAVSIPARWEQFIYAGRLANKAHLSITLHQNTMTEKSLRSAIKTALTRGYAERAQDSQLLARDHMQEPRDKLAWWVRHVISQDDGARYLLSEAAYKLTLWQYLLIDILGLLTAGVLGAVALVIIVLVCACRVVRKVMGGKPKKSKGGKRKKE